MFPKTMVALHYSYTSTNDFTSSSKHKYVLTNLFFLYFQANKSNTCVGDHVNLMNTHTTHDCKTIQ